MKHDQEVYFVKYDHGPLGCGSDIDFDKCSRDDVIAELSSGLNKVAAVIYMNIAEGHVYEVTDEIAEACFTAGLDKFAKPEEYSDFVKLNYQGYEEEFEALADIDRQPYDRLGSFEYGIAAE